MYAYIYARCIHICSRSQPAPLHIQEPPTVRILAGVGARRWTDNISPPRGSRNAASRDLHAETSVRFLFHIVSRRRAHPRETRQPLLRLLPSPLCLFNKLERPNEMMKIALIFRTTAGPSSYSSAGFLLPPWFFISGFSAAWKGCEGCWTNSKRSWSKIDSVSVFWYRYRKGESLRSIRVW